METVTVSTNIDNYTHEYPQYSKNFNELEKLFWSIGQEIQSLKHLHNLYVDSYSILEKSNWLITQTESTRGGFSEKGHRLGVFNLLLSFAPTKDFQTIDELEFYWKLLFLSSVTPQGMRNFVKFLTAYYLVQHNIDFLYFNSITESTRLARINRLLPQITTFIYEWSATQEAQVGGYYFFPGSLPFMSIHLLVGLPPNVLAHINYTELSTYIYNQLQEYRESKLTPTLQVETLTISEAWENG